MAARIFESGISALWIVTNDAFVASLGGDLLQLAAGCGRAVL